MSQNNYIISCMIRCMIEVKNMVKTEFLKCECEYRIVVKGLFSPSMQEESSQERKALIDLLRSRGVIIESSNGAQGHIVYTTENRNLATVVTQVNDTCKKAKLAIETFTEHFKPLAEKRVDKQIDKVLAGVIL